MRTLQDKNESIPRSTCPKCKKRHSSDAKCTVEQNTRQGQSGGNNKLLPLVRTNLTVAKITTKEQLNEYFAEAKKKIGPCPCCNRFHTYERDFPFGKGQVPTRRLTSCNKFMNMDVRERGEFIEKINGCFKCLYTNHKPSDCKWKRPSGCEEKVVS